MNHIAPTHQRVVDRIVSLSWDTLTPDGITAVAWAYYYFSIQFRENLRIAERAHPDDALMTRLVREECGTDNLSPWPGVAAAAERMDHDEFMRRVLALSPIDPAERARLQALGEVYLRDMRAMPDELRAASIVSYEDGGLEAVFTAMLRCRHWDTELLAGFRHFLVKHIGFDSNPDEGHGALIRHLTPDMPVDQPWALFLRILTEAAPGLTHARAAAEAAE